MSDLLYFIAGLGVGTWFGIKIDLHFRDLLQPRELMPLCLVILFWPVFLALFFLRGIFK